jgi:hypothetical protein
MNPITVAEASQKLPDRLSRIYGDKFYLFK